MDLARDWKLLISVLPPVLALAEFYTGEDAEAVAARAEVDRDEGRSYSFYANFSIELDTLKHNSQNHDTSLELPGKAISQVLELLEDRCFILTRLEYIWNFGGIFQSIPKGYKNLEKLVQQIDGGHISNTDTRSLIDKLRFRGSKKNWRDEIIKHLTACNEALSGETSQVTKVSSLVPAFEVSPTKLKRSAKAALYSQERRELEDKVHQVLIEHWRCCCPTKHAEAYLLLQPQTASDEKFDARYDIWLCGATETPDHAPALTWQETDIFVCRSQRRNKRKIEDVDAKTTKSEGKTVLSSTSMSITPPTTTIVDDAWEIDEGVCKLVKQAVKLSPRRLHFIANNEILQYRSPGESTYSSHQHEFISLNKMIANLSSSVITRETALSKYSLSYLLASSFLRICGGSWSPNVWTKDQISFHRYPSKAINIRKPYVATILASEMTANQSVDRSRIRNRIHPYPQVLALGMLFLQIWLGKAIEAERSDDNPNQNSDPESYDIDADRTVAQRMLKSCNEDCLPNFTKAITACLEPQTFPLGKSLKDEAFRKSVYQEIVEPIEKTLLSYGVNVEDETASSKAFTSHPGLHEDPGRTLQSRMIEVPEATTQVAAPSNRSAIGDSAEAEINPDAWIEDLAKFIHPCLGSPAQKSLALSTKTITRNGRVRIAILDTGLELPVYALSIYEERVKCFKDWVVGGKEGTPWVDADGHGTHSAGLIMKIAPDAELYVARVFEKQYTGKDSTSSKATKNNIAKVCQVMELSTKYPPRKCAEFFQAIRHAVDTWEVDIISMSFGFQQSVDVIQEAIMHAYNWRVIMIAAASNDGGNSGITWPARIPEVICIHATDGKGNKSALTPNRLPDARNFSIPGINVKSVWPPSQLRGAQVRKSGTSCATPIAAGLAAIVLEIASLHLVRVKAASPEDVSHWRKLRSVGGMSLVFLQMSSDRDGYNYITPWEFLGDGNRGFKPETAMDVILMDLRKKL